VTDSASRLAAALADRYRIERELGQGGMATVYLAHDIKHDRDVAIKVLHPDLAAALGGERFLSEIKTTAKLQHPHILPLLDSGSADTFLYYVMPYVTGETLRARLERERQLPVEDALLYAREIADALGSAHALGIIHRDIKPENILLQGGHALVADFGIALAVQQAGGQRMTQTGLSLGTPQYMSPEQAMGERVIDARSDIYALGAVTYEMLVGEPPFTGPSVQAIVARVMSEEPRGITSQRKAVPPGVEDAVMRALEKLPADRFGSALEFAAALDARDGQTGWRTGARPAARRSSRGTLLAAAVASVMALVALWGWLRPQPAPAVVRYQLTMDSMPAVRDWSGEIAISPDGELIIRTGGPNGALLMRRRDELGFTPMPGTERAQGPFFSPDGASIGYFSSGRLMTAAIAGGPPTILADSLRVPEAMAWSSDGIIYRIWKNARDQFALGQMEARPGAPLEPLTRVDSGAGETFHLLPEPLPNGKGVLFQVEFLDGRRVIAVADPKTGEHRTLFPGVRVRYARNGHLLYTTADGNLWAVPFDQDAVAVTGTPTLISDAIPSTMTGPVDFAVSTTGTIIYAVDDATDRRELVWVSRTGGREPFDPNWKAAFGSPVLSPDGSRVAVAIRNATTSDIWIQRVTGGAPVKLTFVNRSNDEPAWSPDGRSVSFISGVGNTGAVGDVWVRSVDGAATNSVLVDADRPISEQVWAPDGRTLLVRTTTPSAGAGDILMARPSSGSAPLPLVATKSTEYNPVVSPDGKWLAYVSNETGQLEVYVVPFPEAGSSKWQVSTAGGTVPRWSRRGDEIFFLDPQSNMISARVTTVPTFGLQGQTRLFSASEYVRAAISRRSYDVSADGQRFLMVQRASNAATARIVVVENWFEEMRAKSAKR